MSITEKAKAIVRFRRALREWAERPCEGELVELLAASRAKDIAMGKIKIGTIRVKLVYGGRSKPMPFED